MSRNCQRPESAEISPILECQQAERDDHQKNSLLVYMPAKQKRRVATKGNSADECFPCRFNEEFGKTKLPNVNFVMRT